MCKRANPQLDPTLIGDRIKTALKAAGMQQKELAVTMGVRTATVSRWVTGKAEPSSSNLQGIADVLDVNVEYLTGQDDRMQHPRKRSKVFSKFKTKDRDARIIEASQIIMDAIRILDYDLTTDPEAEYDGEGMATLLSIRIADELEKKCSEVLRRKEGEQNDKDNQL